MSTAATIGLTLLAIFMVLVVLNVPIAVCLGISTLVTSVIFHVPYQGFGDILYTGIAKSSLLAVPFFILCGAIMEKSGTSARIRKIRKLPCGADPRRPGRDVHYPDLLLGRNFRQWPRDRLCAWFCADPRDDLRRIRPPPLLLRVSRHPPQFPSSFLPAQR